MKTTHPQQITTNAKVPKYAREDSTGTWFGCIFYGSVEQLKQFADKELKRLDHLTYIVHDKDVYTEKDEAKNPNHKVGMLKETHIHVLLKNNATISNLTLRNRFNRCCFKDEKGLDINTMTQVAYDPVEADEYLCHDNDERKHTYDPSEKVCLIGDLDDIKRARRKTADGEYIIQQVQRKDNTFEILEKMFQGVSKWQLAKEYGRDFIMNVQKYDYLLRSLNGAEWLEAQSIDDPQGYIDGLCANKADCIAETVDEMKTEVEKMRKLNQSMASAYQKNLDDYMNRVGQYHKN